MSRIPLVEPDNAPPAVRALYDEFSTLGMPLLNVMKMFGNHEGFLSGLLSIAKALYQDAQLSPRYRELAYLRASQLNSCHY